MEKNKKEFLEEKAYLEKVIEEYIAIIKDSRLRLDALPRMYRNNPRLLETLIKQLSQKLELITRYIEKPYFARIDFKSDDEKKIEQCYIGKVGVFDDDNKLITVDWRAPIASMYYDSNIGEANYDAPQGNITGKLLVKRQYDIEKRFLNGFQDIDTVSNDEILKPYLGTNADNRLKNIVASIQSEQNQIIREKINKNLIVQGVAGSGKTTVALHRIAYLVYNNIKNVNLDQYMVIGPNKFFVNYISGILPDLDVNNVNQLTYDELVKDFLKENFTISSGEKKLISSIDDVNKLFFERIKISMPFKIAIDKYMDDFDKTIVPQANFLIKGYQILPHSTIKKIYDEVDKDRYFNIDSRVERAHLLLSKTIEQNYDSLLSKVNSNFYLKISNGKLSKEELSKEIKNLEFVKRELENNCNQSLKKHFSKTNTKILILYSEFIKNISKYLNLQQNDIDTSCKITLQNIKTKTLDFEDMAPLLYLKYKMSGAKEFKKYRHVVIDEAQDFGEFNFYALKKLMSGGTFSIFGDLAQAIYSYRSIENWQQVMKTTFHNNCELKYLLKSYRTTTEIMNTANNITKHIGLNPANPVIRHGNEVSFTEFFDNQDELIVSKLSDYVLKDYSSIALICKNEQESKLLSERLKVHGINNKNISSNDIQYSGGICTIASYLAKGLEFDAAIIVDASEKQYSSEKKIDMKLLYVAMTRSLHELEVLYQEELCKPLQKCLKLIKIN